MRKLKASRVIRFAKFSELRLLETTTVYRETPMLYYPFHSGEELLIGCKLRQNVFHFFQILKKDSLKYQRWRYCCITAEETLDHGDADEGLSSVYSERFARNTAPLSDENLDQGSALLTTVCR